MEATSQLQKMRKYFTEISGPGVGSHPKAHVVLRHYHQYHDGTQRDIQIYSVDKPILTVFTNGPFVYVAMNYRYHDDIDLRMAWRMLADYRDPLNSVSYLDEEVKSGYYMENGEKKMVHYPMLELILSPIGSEDKFEMHGLNPLMFNLGPASPTDPEICVLQLTFDAGWFQTFDNLQPLDAAQLRAELLHEMENDSAAGVQ